MDFHNKNCVTSKQARRTIADTKSFEAVPAKSQGLNVNDEDKENLVCVKPASAFNKVDFSQAGKSVDEFILGQRNKNTVSATTADVNTFTKYLRKLGESRNTEDIQFQELNLLLSKFVIEVRRGDGANFEPDTLSSYVRSVQRYLNEKGKFVLLKEQPEFRKLQDALGGKQKELKKQGLGNKPNACREILPSEEAKLFVTESFSCKDTLGLQRALWWHISKCFGFRGRDESRSLKWVDVKLAKDPETGNDTLIWTTYRGGKCENGSKEMVLSRKFSPHIQGTHDDFCEIKFCREFATHRPEKMCSPESPFFLAIRYKVNPLQDRVWYKNQPLGKNEIGRFMSHAAKQSQLDTSDGRRIANHSVRKTSIGRLLDKNVPESFVIQLSGHKRIESLSSYKAPSFSHQREMSKHLSHSTTLTQPEKEQTSPITSSMKQTTAATTLVTRPTLLIALSTQSLVQIADNCVPSAEKYVLPETKTIASIPSTTSSLMSSMFSGAKITDCCFQIFPSVVSMDSDWKATSSTSARKRRYVITSDSEED